MPGKPHPFPFPQTIGEVAKFCGVTRQHMSAVLHGREGWSGDLAKKLKRLTGYDLLAHDNSTAA